MHAGFPYLALSRASCVEHDLTADDIDSVGYAFADWEEETRLIDEALAEHKREELANPAKDIAARMSNLPEQPKRNYGIPGLDESALVYQKRASLHTTAYRWLSTNASMLSSMFTSIQVNPLARYSKRRTSKMV